MQGPNLLPRRASLRIAALLSAVTLTGVVATPAYAAAGGGYPTRTIRIVDAFPPGGGSDFVVRTLAPKFTETFGQQVIVDNRGGANGIIGNEHVVRSAPDGYTLLIVTGSYAANPSVYKLPYDPINDITILGQVAATSFLLVVHPSLPAKSVKELVALARAKPGAINFGSTGTGGSTHLVMEYFKLAAQVDLTHIPYKGTGPAVSDLVGGQIQVMIAATAPVMPHVKSGRLRALAVTAPKRIAGAPDLPTVLESGVPDYDVTSWYAIVGPRGLPGELVARWNAELQRVVQLPDVRERFAANGMEAVSGPPEAFAAMLKRDVARWAQVVKRAGIKQN
jgi:tripartite-type tricarboxylate transporter receptor subunit TctC